jgi:uncharacterized integral membrane protein
MLVWWPYVIHWNFPLKLGILREILYSFLIHMTLHILREITYALQNFKFSVSDSMPSMAIIKNDCETRG